ncbi:MAG: nucleoside deaminase [Eubacteriales bacterium]
MTETDLLRRTRERDEILARYSAPPDPGSDADVYYMRAALELAAMAARCGDVPVGCVIVRDGCVLAGDGNGREAFGDASYHAETAAIREACRRLGGWRLTRCSLYVTLEPCPMCAGAIWCARVPRVIVGAKDPKAGAVGSVLNVNSYPLNHKFSVTFGILEGECRGILSEFFRGRRKIGG